MATSNDLKSIYSSDSAVFHDISSPFPVVRYRFEFKVTSDIMLPVFAGSALRGVLGHALRRTACMTGLKDCSGCSLRFTCPYTRVFESQLPKDYEGRTYSGVPNPFVVEPVDWGRQHYKEGDGFGFSIVLIGPALDHLPLIIHACDKALKRGIGPARGRARLMNVRQEGNQAPVWNHANGEVQAHDKLLSIPSFPKNMSHASMVFETPLRLQKHGRRVSASSITSADVLNGLLRRVATLIEIQLQKKTNFEFNRLSSGASNIELNSRLEWLEWQRFSNRQKQHMKGSGLVGTVKLTGNLEPYWQLLFLGQYLHLGKMASFGNGKYTLST